MLTCKAEYADRVRGWIRSRGGVSVWKSIDLSDPGAEFLTPALDEHGRPTQRPTWKVGGEPSQVVKDEDEVEVIVPREVKRFHVGTRMGSQGLSIKVTDGGTRRIRASVEKAGDGAWYEFDYGSHENVVIYVADRRVRLSEWGG